MNKAKALASTILIVLSGCSTGESSDQTPSNLQQVKRAPLGVRSLRVPKGVENQLCLDVDSALGIGPQTALTKWNHVVRAFGFSDRNKEHGANNEMHDCQPLIASVRGVDRYTAFATLWVSDVLAQKKFDTLTVVAAVVLVGDTFRFGNLVMRPHRNCILLRGMNHNDNGAAWTAKIVPIGDNDVCPAGSTMPGGTDLHVYRDPSPSKAVAGRWIDTEKGYYIGLQCGDYVCVIGVPTPGVKPEGYNPLWNAESDHQRLATVAPNGELVPSRLRGTITALSPGGPERELSTYNPFVPVAMVELIGAKNLVQKYADKWGVPVDSVWNRRLRMYLKHSAAAGWESRWSLNGPPRPVIFKAAWHSGERTARWRWDPNDEGTWRQCGGGCCGN